MKVRVAVGDVSIFYDGKPISQKRIDKMLTKCAVLNATGPVEPDPPGTPLGFTGELDPDR